MRERHRLGSVSRVMRQSIAEGAFPGAAVAIGRRGRVVMTRGYGQLSGRGSGRVTSRTRYDIASLTKVVGTTTALMKLYEAGRIDLDAPLARYLPDYAAGGKGKVTLRQLLAHTGGLRADTRFHERGITTRKGLLAALRKTPLVRKPGIEAEYSDLGMILLGLVVERVSGQSLGDYLRREVFEPLGMTDTGFRQAGPQAFDATIAPTEHDASFRRRTLQGEVHDEKAHILGGTAGHAGLFSTARDLSRFASTLAAGGIAPNGRRFLKRETIELFTRSQVGGRGLGWDRKSPTGSSAGGRMGPRSFGHTGFTGTSMWIDPKSGVFVVLLSNAVHPSRDNKRVQAVRPRVADLAVAAMR